MNLFVFCINTPIRALWRALKSIVEYAFLFNITSYRESGLAKKAPTIDVNSRRHQAFMTSAPLDMHIYPTADMAEGSIALCQGVGGQKAVFPNAVEKNADLALLAEARSCTKDGEPEKKEGFYQYSAAWDSKHKVTLEDRKSARVLFSMQEMEGYIMPIIPPDVEIEPPNPVEPPELPDPPAEGFIFPFPESDGPFTLGILE